MPKHGTHLAQVDAYMKATKATATSTNRPKAVRCHGRRKETDEFLRLFQDARSGKNSFIHLTGRSGMGKTTLLAEVQHQLRDHGALVMEGHCRPGLPSYQPLAEVGREALAHLVQLNNHDKDLSRWEHTLDVLQGRALSAVGEDHDPGAFRIELFDGFAGLLVATSQSRPVVVLLNDLDFADPGTLDLVRFLGRELTARHELGRSPFSGMMVTSAQHPGALAVEREEINLTSISLDALDADGVKDFLSSDEVVGRVMESTGGVPRLMGRMLTADGLEDNHDSPLAGLDPAARELMEVLAVAGRPLGPDALHDLVELPQDQLPRTIASLSRRQLLEKVATGGELRTGFASAGEQEASYRSLSTERRRQLHARVGEFLAGLGEHELESSADHLLRAGRDLGGARAVQAAVDAGQRLEISCSLEKAADLYERALALTDDPSLAHDLTRRLCELLEVTGHIDRALDHARRLLKLQPDDVEVELRIAHLHLLNTDHASMRRVLEGVQRHPDRWSHDDVLSIRIQATVAESMYLAGETSTARGACREGLAQCHAAEATPVRALEEIRLRNIMGIIHLERGEREEAHALFSLNLDEARAMERRPEELRALAQLGLTEMKRDNYAGAEARYTEARAMAEAMGEHRLLGVCHQHLAVLEERRRNYGKALELYQDAVAVLKKTGHRRYLAWVSVDLGKLYLDLGDVARADAMLAMATRLADVEPPLNTRINMELLHGRLAQSRCKYREAARRFEQAVDLAREAGLEERHNRALLDLAALNLERGEYMSALRLLQDRITLPPDGSFRLRSLLLRAQGSLELDRLETARIDLMEALELNEELDDAEAAWQARYLLSLVAHKQQRVSEYGRWLKEARAAEKRARKGVPEEYLELLADQPLRASLYQSLKDMGRKESSVPVKRRTSDGEVRWRKRYSDIVGDHPRLMQILRHIDRVAPTDTTVLIRGESGTGKELVAQAIHSHSRRSKKALVAVNCGALVESLLLSELFGHERGAFTGASNRKKGRFEVADGGTIFLDEIGDISPRTQAALLRVLQEREFERVGGTAPIQVDVRIICATNRNLEEMVALGEFREDLYYRLRGVQLHLPSLRQRLDDVPLLAEHFLRRISVQRDIALPSLTREADQLLKSYRWPGNVRELENVLRSVSLLADAPLLDTEDFEEYPELATAAQRIKGEQVTRAETPDEPASEGQPVAYRRVRDEGLSLKEYKTLIEQECIREALAEAGGNITRAAKLLGMKRPRLSQLIKEYGLAVR